MLNDRYVNLILTKYIFFLYTYETYNILNKNISQSYYYLTNYTNTAVRLHALRRLLPALRLANMRSPTHEINDRKQIFSICFHNMLSTYCDRVVERIYIYIYMLNCLQIAECRRNNLKLLLYFRLIYYNILFE